MPANTIDVVIAVDCKSIMKDFPELSQNPENPTFLVNQHKYIYMLAPNVDVNQGQGTPQLAINAKTGDVIRWRETTMSLGRGNTAFLYKYDALSNGQLIMPPMLIPFEVETPYPNLDDPYNPRFQNQDDYVWQTTALRSGTVTYRFRVMLLDDEGNKLGYCTWDPYIIITRS